MNFAGEREREREGERGREREREGEGERERGRGREAVSEEGKKSDIVSPCLHFFGRRGWRRLCRDRSQREEKEGTAARGRE